MAAHPHAKPLILRVVSRMAIGGVQRGILATLARADRLRFDYAVLCTKKEGAWAEAVRALDVDLICRKTMPPWHPIQILRLARTLRRLNPDLVHIHMAPLVIPVASACRLAGVRHYVIQHHSNYERFWMEQQNRFLRAWERRLTRGASAVIAVSESAAQANAALLGFAPERVTVVPNGIELDRFRDAEPVDPRPDWGIAPGRPLVVQVSRYLDTKRIEDFIAAGAQVLRGWPADAPAPVFVVLGGGSEEYRHHYEALIRREGVDGQVLLPGSRHDVPNVLKSCQVGVLASENEGFGQVVLEYAAAGLPVAAVALPSLTAMLVPDRAALYSPARRPELLAANIRRLLEDRALAERLVTEAAAVLPRYDWLTAVRGYEAIYDRILAQP